ncbi:MAG: hypothetical protein JF591_12375 [Lysobacter sp.]|nr:hypothetical protein [Lysobacter sp.]
MADRDELNAVFDGFTQRGATEHQLRILEASLRSSPELNRAMTDTIASGRVSGLRFLPPESPALASYAPTTREIGFKPEILDSDIDRDSLDRLTYAFGHEISHAQQGNQAHAAEQAIANEMRELAHSGARPRDYTQLVERYDAVQRQQEARAELSGINMLADRLRHEGKGQVSESALARRADPVSSCAKKMADGSAEFAPGLSFDPKSQSFPATPQNIEAVATCFYDIKRAHGYSESSKATAIGWVADAEFQARKLDPDRSFNDVHIDLARLKLDPAALKRQDIDLGRFHDKTPFEFIDPSTRAAVEIHHRASKQLGHPALPAPAEPALPSGADLAMLEQIRAGVRANDERIGKPYDELSERLSRATLAACKDNHDMHPGRDYSLSANALNRVDHIVMGATGHLFAVEGRLDDPAHKRATVIIEQAIKTPVEQSDQKLQAANQAIAHERQREESLSPQQTQHNTQDTTVLSR